MIKQNKIRIQDKKKSTNKNANKNEKIEKFMTESFITPNLDDNEINYDNLIKSPASVASRVLNKNDNQEYEDSYDEYNSNDEYNSDDEYDNNNNKSNDMYKKYDEKSYSTLTKNKDIRILKMKNILEERKKQMLEKEKEMKDLQKDNSFLESIIIDYQNYNRSILEEKNKQKIAIKILSEHIRDISRNINNDDYKLNNIKMDQSILLKELQTIRNEVKDALLLNGSESNNSFYHDVSSDDVSSDEEYYHDE